MAGAFRRLLGLLRGIEEERLRAVHRFLAAARAEEEREADAAALEAGLGAARPEKVKGAGIGDFGGGSSSIRGSNWVPCGPASS